jgi:hypothetical protein
MVEQLTKALKLMLLSNSYLLLPRTQGDLQPTSGTRERLEERLPREQDLLVVEICGVLGRLHSSQGLAHSNNNAKLNDSAKHETNVASNK